MARTIRGSGELLLCFLFAVSLSACTSYNHLQKSDVITMNSQLTAGPYTLGVGDVIAVKFFYNKDLDEEVTVRPDGMISLQLIGDVKAAGLSSSELVSSLKEKYAPILESIDENGSTAGSKSYTLSVGDVIAVKFFYNKDLDEEVTVRPDGMISLQLIGDVKAAGLSSSELASLLKEKYNPILDLIDLIDETGSTADSKPYTLGVGDVIAVKFFYNKDLNEEVSVRPDGMISLQLIGDVKAAGLSSSELVSLLKEKYAPILESIDENGATVDSKASEIAVIVKKSASASEVAVIVKKSASASEIAVIVKESASQYVYVGGQIQRPGRVPINGQLRLLDAVILTGGPLDTAELEQTTLLRMSQSQEPEISHVNLKMIAKGEIPDITLKPMDVIYLPKTGVAEVGWFFQQYLHSIIPVGGNVIYNLNPEVQVK